MCRNNSTNQMEWLISTQIVTLALFLISEILGISTSDLNGILDALYKVYKKTQTSSSIGIGIDREVQTDIINEPQTIVRIDV